MNAAAPRSGATRAAHRAVAEADALRRALRAFPGMLKISFAEAVAYRAEFLVWMLSTTMPFIQMALMRSIASEAPIHGADRVYEADTFTGYYLAALFVRMLTGAWVVWEMNQEIRTGAFSMRLLRPIHPFLSYASDNLAALPMRGVLGIPLVVAMMLATSAVTRDPASWGLAMAAIALAWAINFLVNCCVGCLAFFFENAVSVFEVWLALWMIFSGYLFPLDLFPSSVRAVLAYLPFGLMMDLPVRLLTGTMGYSDAFRGIGLQLLWIAGLFLLMRILWTTGGRRFRAVGG